MTLNKAFQVLANICKGTAFFANEIGKSPHAMSGKAQENLNSRFEKASSAARGLNVARMPDEAFSYSLIAGGAALDSIAELLFRGTTVPFSPAVLARTCVENAALVSFLTQGAMAHEQRIARGVNVVISSYKSILGVRGIKNTAEGREILDIFDKLKKVQSSLGQISSPKRDKLPGYEKLVEGEFPERGGDFYEYLSRSVHHNYAKQVQLNFAEEGFSSNAGDTYRLALESAWFLAKACFSACNYKEIFQSEYREYAEGAIFELERFESQFGARYQMAKFF